MVQLETFILSLWYRLVHPCIISGLRVANSGLGESLGKAELEEEREPQRHISFKGTIPPEVLISVAWRADVILGDLEPPPGGRQSSTQSQKICSRPSRP